MLLRHSNICLGKWRTGKGVASKTEIFSSCFYIYYLKKSRKKITAGKMVLLKLGELSG